MNKNGFNHIDEMKMNNSKINSNKGFTLVELIVVMVVLSIMLTLGGLAILKWQDWATFNQENEYAQTLFVAAQNQLAEYSANGRLETLQKDLKDGDAYGASGKGLILRLDSDSFGIINEEGIKYTKDSVWVEAYKKTAAERDKYIDDIVAIRADSGDYDMYESDPAGLASTNPEAYWVYELLGAYVYDKSILNNAAISIEFTPDDGQVFAVLYSDKNSSFIYKTHEGVEESAGISDIEDRQELYRNDRMVGYYGVDTLTKATRDKAQMEAKIENVILHNENSLNLTFDLTEGEVNSLDYKVTVRTSDIFGGVYSDALEINIPAGILQSDMKEVLLDVTRKSDEKKLGKMPFIAGYKANKDGDPQIVLVLDAVDIHAQANAYIDLLDATEEQKGDAVFTKTYSIFRFGVDMAYAKCEVVASGLNYSEYTSPESNREHMCMETMKETSLVNSSEKVMEYSLTNIRHLYNVRFVQEDINRDASYVGANYIVRNNSDQTVYDETEDQYVSSDIDGKNIIDWGALQNSVSSYNKLYDSKPSGAGWTIDKLPTNYSSIEKCPFPSIELLGKNDQLYSEVPNYELKNFKLDSKSNVVYMLSKNGIDINSNINEYIDMNQEPVGLVKNNNGSIRNLQMTNVDASGKEYVGAFAGENHGEMKSLSVVNVDTKEIFGEKYLGAITGYNYEDGTVDMCQAKAGTIGRKRDDVKVKASYVGGLVGCNKGTVKNTDAKLLSNVAAVYGDEYIGGAVGYNDKEAVIDGLKFNCGIVDGVSGVGGIAGYNAGAISATNKISITPNVFGTYYVGGVVGYNDTGATITKYEVNKGTIIGDENNSCYVGGYVGFNSSIDLLQGQDKKALVIMSSPSKVTGAYYVGGCIGGNILNTHGYSNKVEVDSNVDNNPGGAEDSDITEPGEQINEGNLTVLFDNHNQLSNDSQNTIWVHFRIVNDTDNAIVNWTADLSYLKKYGDFYIIDNSNSDCEVGSYIVKPKYSWAQNVGPHSAETKSSIRIIAADSNIRKKIEEDLQKNGLKINATYDGSASVYQMLASVGPVQLRTSNPAPDNGSYWAEMMIGDRNNNDTYAQYKVVLHNETNAVLKDWSVTIDFGSDIMPANGEMWGAECNKINGSTYEYKSTQWSYHVPANGTLVLYLNVKTNDSYPALYDNYIAKTSFDWFVDGNKVFSFNAGTSGGGNTDPTPVDPTPDDPTPEDPTIQIDVINASFANSNYAGELSGKAFVGGYIGYNMMVDSSDVDAVRKYVQVEYIKKVEESNSLENLFKNVEDIKISSISDNGDISASKVHMFINRDKTNVSNNIGKVIADICVGGIFGYNNEETNLTIYNSNNFSTIKARTSIRYDVEQLNADGSYRTTDYEGKIVGDDYYTYSYAGGIIGVNNSLTVLDNCANKSASLVDSKGTYSGGLCEVNRGIIRNCDVENFGDPSKDYIGGLCGLNRSLLRINEAGIYEKVENTGVIDNCRLINKTIGGRNVVGGIAAENLGYIKNVELVGSKIIAYGSYNNNTMINDAVSGLYVGYNGTLGEIILKAKEKTNDSATILGTVEASGRYAGLIVGYNVGSIDNGLSVEINSEDKYILDGSVYGEMTVGSLCGYNGSLDIVANYTNDAQVTAKNGEAGGIIGSNGQATTIKYCINNATVLAPDKGNAGGITSYNDGLIIGCNNYSEVSSPNGMCGGITAINEKEGKISDYYVGNSDAITFSSQYAAGGVAAINRGLITVSNNIDGEGIAKGVKNVIVQNAGTLTGTKLGLVVGENSGSIILGNAFDASSCKINTSTNNCQIGGIAGNNSGTITTLKAESGESIIAEITNCDFEIVKDTYASIGGVAGVNTGTISNIAVNNIEIKGYLGSASTGYGGIAGISGYITGAAYKLAISDIEENYPVKIENCTFDGSIGATGTAGAIANVGGITGVNGYGSEINACYIGVRGSGATYIYAGEIEPETVFASFDGTYKSELSDLDKYSYAYVGGISGCNYGKISDIDMNGKVNDEVKVLSFAGAAGGFVGYNYPGAIISGSSDTNKVTSSSKMSVVMLRGENNRGPGGFVGVNLSGQPIKNADNWAKVYALYPANMKAGGFFGSNMQQESYQLSIANCNNYGEVVGWANVGGFVGHDWYRGINFKNCVNYASIKTVGYKIGSTEPQNHAGGFIGRVCSTSTSHYFEGCQNHGNISSRGTNQACAGGFVGQVEKSCGALGELYNCVNTGIIINNDLDCDNNEIFEIRVSDEIGLGHFVGFCDNKSSWTLNLCRNYNTNNVTDGFAFNSKCINCFDASLQVKSPDDLKYNSGDSGSYILNSYYLTNDEVQAESSVDYGAYFTVHGENTYLSGEVLKNVNWKIRKYNPLNSSYKDCGYSTFRNYELLLEKPNNYIDIYTDNTSQNQLLNFNLSTDDSYKGISEFSVYLRTVEASLTGTTKYRYICSVTLLDNDGNELSTLTKDIQDVCGNFDIDRYKVTFNIPDEYSNSVKNILLKTSCWQQNNDAPKSPHFFGFAWKPSNSDEEVSLAGLSSKYQIYTSISDVSKDKFSVVGVSDYDYFWKNDNAIIGNIFNTEYYKTDSNIGFKFTPGFKNDVVQSQKFTISNNYLGDAGMDYVYMYISNDFENANNTYKYEYSYSITDENGCEYKSNSNEIECNNQNERIVIDVKAVLNDNYIQSKKITKIVITIKNVSVLNDGIEVDPTSDVFVKGFTYVPSDKNEEMHFVAYADRKWSDIDKSFSDIEYGKDYSGFHPLYIDNKENETSSYSSVWDANLHLALDKNNTVNSTYINDKAQSSVENVNVESSNSKDSRMAVYWDLDSKFIALVDSRANASNNAFKLPTNLKAALQDGSLVFTWDTVKYDINGQVVIPYGYEVAYELYDSNFNRVSITDEDAENIQRYTNASRTEWNNPLSIKEEWINAGYTIRLKVRAINSSSDLSSDNNSENIQWAECELKLYLPELPQPVVHIEVSSDNKMIAVLDNPEDFEETIYVDVNGSITQQSFADICNIVVNWDGLTWKDETGYQVKNFVIDPSGQNVYSSECMYISGGSFKVLSAYAEPKTEYKDYAQNSSTYTLKGNFVANGSLVSNDRYSGTTITFAGFKSSDASTLQYDINVKNGDDAFLTADFGAYDDETGLYVYYDRSIGHIGASAGGGDGILNSFTLSNIPIELFGEEHTSDMEARIYLESSQNGIVHYGHEVLLDFDLDFDTKEEAYAYLAEIVDENYLTTEGHVTNVQTNYVWNSDENEFNPGYSLYLNSDGTYSIYYNATIELAMDKAIADNESKEVLTNGVARKYYKYAVDVMRFNEFDLESNSNRTINNVKINSSETLPDLNYLQDGYYLRRQAVNSGDYNAFNVTKNNVNPYKYFINIAPTPIVDGDMSVTSDDEGRTTYSVQWDKYYKDTYAWDASKGYYNSTEADKISYAGFEIDDIDITDKITLPTVATWEEFKANTNFYEGFIGEIGTAGKRQWLRFAMNAYFYSYDNARYEAVLLGKTSSGEYVELSSIDVDSPVALSMDEKFSYSISYDNINKKVNDNEYEYKVYQAEFTESNNEWSGYSDITIRIIRIGNNNRYGKGVDYPDKTNIASWNEDYLYVLPRYTEVSYEQKQPLQTLMTPSISMVENEDGTTTESLLYNVSFGLVNDSDMLPDVGGYIIEVKEVIPASGDAENNGTDDGNEENTGDLLPGASDLSTTYYVVKQKGVALTNYGLEGDETVIDVSKNFTSENGYGSSVIDLYEYSNKTVEISVRALARDNVDVDNPTKYTHGQYSAAREVMILEALPVPVLTSFVNTEVKESESEDSKILNYEFSYIDVDDDSDDIGDLYGVICSKDADVAITIQAKIDIFDEKSESKNIVGTLYTEEEPLDITRFGDDAGLSTLTSVSLVNDEISEKKIFEDYAGYWIRIALRAHSESIIDSKWTDEMDSEILSDDDMYIWIQIPKMEVEDTTTIETTDTISYEVKKYDDVTVDDKTYEVSVVQQSFNILIDSDVDIYAFDFAKADNATGAEVPEEIVIERFNEDVEGTEVTKWYLMKYDSEGNVSDRVDISSETEIEGFTNDISVTLDSEEDASTASLTCKAYISVVDDGDKQYVKIVVPDALSVSLKTENGSEKVVKLAEGDNSNGFISILSMEVISKLNEENTKQKDLKTNDNNKYVFKKEDLDDFIGTLDSLSLDDEEESEEIPEEEILDEENLDDSSFDEENLDESESESEPESESESGQEDPVDTPEGIIPDESTSGGDTPAGDESGSEEHDDNSEDGSNGSSEGSDTEE